MLNIDAFIEKARQVHGDRYDYSQTTVTPGVRLITVICKNHGKFSQDKYSHLYGFNCPKCNIKNKSFSMKEFIEKARQVHGDRYDYSKVDYVNYKSNVIIICKDHGEFTQTPRGHYNGNGCPKCNPTLPRTTEQFIEKAKEIHGDKYDYSKVEYTNSFNKIVIICPVHGEFKQDPYVHLRKSGCRICGNIAKAVTLEEFIIRAVKIHNNKYNYSKVKIKGSDNKIVIMCPVHGEFKQKVNTHLLGHGCYSCGREALRINTDAFIEKAKQVHGDRYDYSKVVFTTTRDQVTIICNKKNHGEFRQKANNHLNGAGCPYCKKSKAELFIMDTLKELGLEVKDEYVLPETPWYSFRYDFYIEKYDLFIEFHGAQHYKDIPFFNRGTSLEDRRKVDFYKIGLIKEMKRPILVFNYMQFKDKKKFKEMLIMAVNKVIKNQETYKLNKINYKNLEYSSDGYQIR